MPSGVYVGNIMERVKAYVVASDLPDALKAFRETKGMDATMVEVSPKIFPILEDIMPEGVELISRGGVAAWEIWLSAPDVKEKAKSIVVIDKDVIEEISGKPGWGMATLEITDPQDAIGVPTPAVKPLDTAICIIDKGKDTTPIFAKTLSKTKRGRGRPKKELQTNFLDILSDKSMNLEEKGKILGIHFTTVQRRMKKLGIPRNAEAL